MNKQNFNRKIFFKCQTFITALKNVMIELKNSLEAFSIRSDQAERMNERKDRAMEFIQSEKHKRKRQKRVKIAYRT